MKKLSPSDWVKLSKEGLGLSDVITMAYVNNLTQEEYQDNHFGDALRYSLSFYDKDGKELSTFEEVKPEPLGIIKLHNELFDEGWLENFKKQWEDVLKSSANVFNAPIITGVSGGSGASHSIGGNGGSGRSNPVYNNTLEDHKKKTEQEYGRGYRLVRKECECGAMKTYGKDCKRSFHSDWCPLK